ncbi:hypothetical protein BVY00_02490, partial [bacterium G20]
MNAPIIHNGVFFSRGPIPVLGRPGVVLAGAAAVVVVAGVVAGVALGVAAGVVLGVVPGVVVPGVVAAVHVGTAIVS